MSGHISCVCISEVMERASVSASVCGSGLPECICVNRMCAHASRRVCAQLCGDQTLWVTLSGCEWECCDSFLSLSFCSGGGWDSRPPGPGSPWHRGGSRAGGRSEGHRKEGLSFVLTELGKGEGSSCSQLGPCPPRTSSP